MKKTTVNNFSKINEAINSFVESVKEGNESFLNALFELREFKKAAELIVQKTKDFEKEFYSEIQQESLNYKNEYKGRKISFQSRETWDFSNIPQFIKMNDDLKEMQKKYKNSFALYQKNMIPLTKDENNNIMWVDSETGESFYFPEKKYGESFITIK